MLHDSPKNLEQGARAPGFPLPAASRFKDLSGRLLQRRGRMGRLMLFFVFLPTLLVFLYLSLFHAPMYVSGSMFAVRTGGGTHAVAEGGLGAIVGAFFTGGSGGSNSQIVLAYITSRHMLEQVASEIDLVAHYSARSRDLWSRLRERPTREELLAYWQWVAKASYDMEKGIISVETKAYARETAMAVNSAVLRFSEVFVNDMNRRAQEDNLRLASQEVQRAEARVAAAAAAIRAFRDSRRELDPAMTAKGLGEVVAGLEAAAARTEAELNAALQIMRPDSLGVLDIQNRLRGIHTQIEREKSRLAGMDGKQGPLSALVGDYAGLILEEEFANKQLVSAMGMHETARIQAIAQTTYIVPIQPPTLAEESEYPRPFLFTFLGFIGFMTALGLVSLTVAAIGDHMGV